LEIAAYSTVAMTLGLVVTRPRIGAHLRLSPAAAAFLGVIIMAALGIVTLGHIERAATELWSPFVAIASIMVMTDVALRVGLLDFWSSRVEARASSTSQLFALVFGLGVVTSATLNNDAAILLLTPLVLALVRRRYPDRPELAVPFAFAVFVSAGVAALPVSNPMNMVVADFMGISFNSYVVHMLPVALACWVVGFLILRRIFAKQLADVPLGKGDEQRQPATTAQKLMMLLLLAVLCAYPIVGFFGGPVWAVASCGALMALVLGARHGQIRSATVLIRGVSWQTLAFLSAVLILSFGLFEVGLVDRLALLYADGGAGTVGTASALGSAVLNNHPMSHLNMLALQSTGATDVSALAALVGGDLGPRLLPIGSLAGLLWLELLRRQGHHVSLGTFAKVGALVTIPSLIVGLSILALLA